MTDKGVETINLEGNKVISKKEKTKTKKKRCLNCQKMIKIDNKQEICFYHSEELLDDRYPCCKRDKSPRGCVYTRYHVFSVEEWEHCGVFKVEDLIKQKINWGIGCGGVGGEGTCYEGKTRCLNCQEKFERVKSSLCRFHKCLPDQWGKYQCCGLYDYNGNFGCMFSGKHLYGFKDLFNTKISVYNDFIDSKVCKDQYVSWPLQWGKWRKSWWDDVCSGQWWGGGDKKEDDFQIVDLTDNVATHDAEFDDQLFEDGDSGDVSEKDQDIKYEVTTIE